MVTMKGNEDNEVNSYFWLSAPNGNEQKERSLAGGDKVDLLVGRILLAATWTPNCRWLRVEAWRPCRMLFQIAGRNNMDLVSGCEAKIHQGRSTTLQTI